MEHLLTQALNRYNKTLADPSDPLNPPSPDDCWFRIEVSHLVLCMFIEKEYKPISPYYNINHHTPANSLPLPSMRQHRPDMEEDLLIERLKHIARGNDQTSTLILPCCGHDNGGDKRHDALLMTQRISDVLASMFGLYDLVQPESFQEAITMGCNRLIAAYAKGISKYAT